MRNTDEGKKELCKKMWIENKDLLTQMCKYKLSNYPDEVEDVISDAFCYLCVAVFAGKVFNDPQAWLLAVTNNLIKKKYQEIKNKKQKQVSYNEEIFQIQSDKRIDIEDIIVSEFMIERLSDVVINELSLEEQLLYEYAYDKKLKTKEIASFMNLTEVNVRQRNHRLRKKLKAIIQRYLEDI